MNCSSKRPIRRSGIRISDGFTLIELMIVVAIVAILATIAYPSYDESVRRGRRADAQTQLLQAGQFLERSYTTNAQYATALPTGLQQSPSSGTAHYTIAVTTNTPNNTQFTLTATATGAMSGDRCGNFILQHTGEKALSGNTAAITDCWKR